MYMVMAVAVVPQATLLVHYTLRYPPILVDTTCRLAPRRGPPKGPPWSSKILDATPTPNWGLGTGVATCCTSHIHVHVHIHDHGHDP